MKQVSLPSFYIILLGLFFLIEGVWGFFSPMVFGVFSTNYLHASVHIILGLIGIRLGYADRPLAYCLLVGLLLLLVGILRLVPSTGPLIVQLLNVNLAVAYLNICIGILSMLMAVFVSRMPTD
jgi:heme A synthase